MGLYGIQDKVNLISYQYTVDFDNKQVTYMVTLQNLLAEVVTQKLNLHYKIRGFLSGINSWKQVSATLDPSETKIFEFTITVPDRVGGIPGGTPLDIRSKKNSYWVEIQPV